uniref:Uncharacterized protein n=1 Tax=Setaria italica TaxID=4555 RepID=K3ZAI4_SETIT
MEEMLEEVFLMGRGHDSSDMKLGKRGLERERKRPNVGCSGSRQAGAVRGSRRRPTVDTSVVALGRAAGHAVREHLRLGRHAHGVRAVSRARAGLAASTRTGAATGTRGARTQAAGATGIGGVAVALAAAALKATGIGELGPNALTSP